MPLTPHEALTLAMSRAGGTPRLFAGAISTERLAVYPAKVYDWLARKQGVPAAYAPAIERVTGVRCEQLCPHVDWAYFRELCGGQS